MTNYNDGKWHGWNGGECPVDVEIIVEVICDDTNLDGGEVYKEEKRASFWNWNDCDAPIIAFRVVKEHREPKEYTIDPRKNIIWYSS